MKKITILILTLATTLALHAQVAINKTGTVPDNSAMLDVQSTTTGMLVPRMNTTQREAISSPANGLLVYDLTTGSFWFYQNSDWIELRAGNITSLSDVDGDTKVIVDNGTDGDIIAFYSKGVNVFSMDSMRLLPKWNSIYIGRNAGGNAVNENNIAIGDSTLFNNDPDGGKNIAIGCKSLYSNSIGFLNTAVGTNTLFSNYSGAENTAVGSYAMHLATGSHSVAFGSGALYNNWGWYNTALGYRSLSNNTSGAPNVAVGAYALYTNTTGSHLVAVGDSALFSNTGQSNTAVGSNALFSNTTGSNNIAIGTKSLFSATENNNNIAIGNYTLKNLLFTTNEGECGNSNIAIGNNAMLSSQKGSYSVVVGHNALRSNVQSWQNTAIGEGALYSSTGSNNTAVGSDVFTQLQNGNFNVGVGCYNDIPSSDQGGTENFTGNSILGANTGINLSTGGNYNTLIGFSSGVSVNSGCSNVALGAAALYSNTSRSNLVAIGDSALYYNGTDASSEWDAINNTAVGSKALFNNTKGGSNSALGYHVLYENTWGYKNTANGYLTMVNNLSGYQNSAFGSGALSGNTDGYNNTAVGYNAGNNLTSGYNNTILGGNEIEFPNATGHDQLNICNIIYGTNVDGTENTVSTGNIGIGVKYPDERLQVYGKIRMDYSVSGIYWTRYIDGAYDYNFAYTGTALSYINHNNGAYIQYSDRRLKSNIKPLSSVITSILALQPVTYYFKSDNERQEQIGMIAQDVEKYFPQAVYEKEGYKSIDYSVFGVLAIEAIKEQQKEIENLKLRITEIDKLKQRMARLEQLLKKQ